MKALMVDDQRELAQLGFEGLGLKPAPHPRRTAQGDFVGSEVCCTCHEDASAAWKRSGHALAMKTLVGLDPPRQFDPECVACHVTGWHPQDCFPYITGYSSLDSTPTLAAVGCESCHGPGGSHAAAEAGSNVALQERLRAGVVLTLDDAKREVCLRCHDVSNSPDFEFEAYWSDVAH
jgi:hypothetical protein